MFSTNDDGMSRPVIVRIRDTAGEREVDLPPDLGPQVLPAAFLPTTGRLAALGSEIAALERSSGREIQSVEISVWRLSYDSRTLAPRPELVRSVSVPGPGSGQGH